MLNIVIPMAGRGQRFKDKSYRLPKPLLPIRDRRMVQVVVDNVCPKSDYKLIFLCLKEHVEEFQIEQWLRQTYPGCEVIIVSTVTEGALCTVLLAEQLINTPDPLLIANSDQWVNFNIGDFLHLLTEQPELSGAILTMTSRDPKCSFIKFGPSGNIVGVVEKQVVSDEATVGIYLFSSGQEFVADARRMIAAELRVNGEFYVAPVYNQLLERGGQIGILNVGKEYEDVWSLGTPNDYEFFLKGLDERKVKGW
ncbi:MAG: glycosyltransferase family 2 protein [Desulforhabdus sp.]|nr:glycosyltransferase family 2 protein [Desulforhabdus sp.]